MISAVVLTKDEEENIKECLEGLSWCDEVIIIDDNSVDKTVDIAKRFEAKIYIHPLEYDFSAQRNFGLEKTKGDWILFIDADERISPALWYEIMAITNDPSNEYSGFYLKRKDVIWRKQLNYGETGNIKLLRLAKRDVGKWQGKVHETWIIKGKTSTLQNSLTHYPHQSIKKFLQEINYYTNLRAQELYKKKVRSYWWSIILFPKGKFFLNFLIKKGILDGLPGLIFALLMSFHSFLVRGKLWLLWQKK